MGDGDHFGAAGDWTEDKTKRLGRSLGELVQIAVKSMAAERDVALEGCTVARTLLLQAEEYLRDAERDRDAAIARAEQAERERDEAQRERNQAIADKKRILSLENMR